ncbi:MAG: YesL family protein [Velocimicrobium sp.]
MGNFFNMDGGVMGTLSKITDVIILSLIFLVFSIPIITMGASFTALYYSAVKSVRRGRSYIFKSFWKSFKENFGSATVLWLIILLAGAILGLNLWFSGHVLTGKISFVLFCIYAMMAVTISLVIIYIFPLLSRFNMSKKKLISTAFFMAIKHLPYSVLMVFIFIASLVASYIVPLLIFVMPAAGALLLSMPMERILKKYMPESVDASKDEWYLE